jgi:hypothetical protein
LKDCGSPFVFAGRLSWIGHINLAGLGINSDRIWVIKLAVAAAFAAPDREKPAIGTELKIPVGSTAIPVGELNFPLEIPLPPFEHVNGFLRQ